MTTEKHPLDPVIADMERRWRDSGIPGIHVGGNGPVSGETREKIRTAPGKSRQQPQQNSHVGLRGLARLGGLAFLRFEAENGHDLLQVFPDFAFRAGIAQQIGGMIGGH